MYCIGQRFSDRSWGFSRYCCDSSDRKKRTHKVASMRLDRPARFLLSASDVRERGLELLKRTYSHRATTRTREESIMSLYGSSSRVLAEQWYDLTTTSVEGAKLDPEDISEAGFLKFMKAHNWVWDYPKNAETFAQRWDQSKRISYGEHVWDFIMKIAQLKHSKIVWEDRLDDVDLEIFIISVDGVDFRIREVSNARLNKVPGNCSHKHRHGALRYEIAVSVKTGRCVSINGPFRGAESELTIFDSSLSKKMLPGKMGIADGGYSSRKQLSCTNVRDREDVRAFKRRVRMRHETFNGRLKNFRSLQDTFHHHQSKHGYVFDMVCVTVQYQLDCGAPLFTV